MLKINSFLETKNAGMCGPASLKMVLEYFGTNVKEAELASLCGTDVVHGTSDLGIKKAAEKFGFTVEIKNFCTYQDIDHWLSKGIPVIVDWFTKGVSNSPDDQVADGHYSVVVDLDHTYIYLQDPEIGEIRKISRDDFWSVWFDFTGASINSWDEMIIRQIIVVYPTVLNE